MRHLRTDHLPLPYRVSLDRPHRQIGLADNPPTPFIVPRTPAKVRKSPDPVRSFAQFMALMSVISDRVAVFFNNLQARYDTEYRAARAIFTAGEGQ